MNDEGKRGDAAVAFSMVEATGGKLFVFMDRLTLSESSGDRHRVWHHEAFVTTLATDRSTFDNLDFSEQQLRGIGLMVMSALRTLYEDELKLRPQREREMSE